jgi:hypothetical protein
MFLNRFTASNVSVVVPDREIATSKVRPGWVNAIDGNRSSSDEGQAFAETPVRL